MNPPQLQFPPGISLERQGQTYVIFRNKREEIGGVALTETPLGDTQLRPYLAAGKESDKTTVAFIAQQMSDVLLMHQAQKPAHLRREPYPPNNLPEGVKAFENKLLPCSRCGQFVAKLIFAEEVSSAVAMEDLAKKLELEAFVSAYPIWIIGAPDSENDDIAKHLTLQIAPIKGAVYWEHPDKMNQRLIELDDHHC
ncbi:hypothetical protein [Shewanella colwelliana]|uniref:hypothetical protein n=1 Tax=Shewanella colwelliana TaxID=23 RepID=UPI0037365F16